MHSQFLPRFGLQKCYFCEVELSEIARNISDTILNKRHITHNLWTL